MGGFFLFLVRRKERRREGYVVFSMPRRRDSRMRAFCSVNDVNSNLYRDLEVSGDLIYRQRRVESARRCSRGCAEL